MADSELHPLDFDALRKDSVIDQAEIERIFNVRKKQAPDAFQLCQLRLSQDIERNRRDLLVRIQGDSIRIMTDSEANEHTWKEYRRGVRKIAKQARRRSAIASAELPEAERRVAELRDQHITVQAIMNRRALAKAQRDMLIGAGHVDQEHLLGAEVEA
jgi:hypothetical protein